MALGCAGGGSFARAVALCSQRLHLLPLVGFLHVGQTVRVGVVLATVVVAAGLGALALITAAAAATGFWPATAAAVAVAMDCLAVAVAMLGAVAVTVQHAGIRRFDRR